MSVKAARERNRRELVVFSGFIGWHICVFSFLTIVLLCVFHSQINCQGSSA